MKPLKDLGNRLCIIGPSAAGKSTLAVTLGEKLSLPVTHLDQIAHIPNTNWQRRPNEEFSLDHAQLINQKNWVIEGNYSFLMPERFSKASAVIWIDPNVFATAFRAIKRGYSQEKRHGHLDGAPIEASFKLTKYTLLNTYKGRKKYSNILYNYKDLPVIKITSMAELNTYYSYWGLTRP